MLCYYHFEKIYTQNLYEFAQDDLPFCTGDSSLASTYDLSVTTF